MGAESIKELLEAIDLEKEADELKKDWKLLKLSGLPETVRNG